MSNLLNKASIIITPTGYDTSELLAIKPSNGDGDLDFSRASTATRTNALQTIENVSINVPRIDYTGGVGNILLEPQSTNLVTYSEDFSDSYWNKSVTISKSSGVSPTGELNAFKYENSGLFNQTLNKAFTLLANTNYTFTIYIKKINSNSFSSNDKIRIGSYGSGITTDYALLGDALNSANIGEWVRYEFSVLTNSTGGSVTFQLRSDEACAIDIFGAQLEQQSLQTSYIPTSGSTVTRLGETLTNSGNADLFNDTEGVLYAEIFKNSQLGVSTAISFDTSSGRLKFYIASQKLGAEFFSSGGNISFYNNNIDLNDYNKIAFRYNTSGETSLFLNGVKIRTSNATTSALSISSLSFDYNGGEPFYGKTKCVAVFKEALTDVQLQCLTS